MTVGNVEKFRKTIIVLLPFPRIQRIGSSVF